MKNSKITTFSIRFTVVSLFLLLATLIISAMFFMQFQFSETLAKKAAKGHFTVLSEQLNKEIYTTDKSLSTYIDLFESILDNQKKHTGLKLHKNLLATYTTFLEQNENLYCICIGNDNNFYFQIAKLDIDEQLIKRYDGKEDDKWFMIEIDENSTTKTITLLDKSLNITSVKTEPTKYKPTIRPWYKKAVQFEGEVVKTDPYQFANIDARGITYAKKMKNGLVFAADILVANLDKMLTLDNSTNNFNSVIIDQDLNLVAKSNPKNHQALISTIKNKLKTISLEKMPIHSSIDIEKHEYIYYIDMLGDDFLISFSDLSTLVAPYREKIKNITLIAIFILLLLFPIIWRFASVIVKPIKQLAKENKKIEKFKFNKVKKVNSKISEIAYLSKSFVRMAKSIRQNQKNLEHEVRERTKELELLSITDKLTGLVNRVKIDEHIKQEIARFDRYENSFGVIFVDIDHFKIVNDTYGHQVGDEVLVEFANLLEAYTRKTDIVGRWGGEEFIILCIEVQKDTLVEIAQKIRKTIENHDFATIGKKTASFGVTLCKKDESPEELVDRADRAMYKAKQNGRNRVEVIF